MRFYICPAPPDPDVNSRGHVRRFCPTWRHCATAL